MRVFFFSFVCCVCFCKSIWWKFIICISTDVRKCSTEGLELTCIMNYVCCFEIRLTFIVSYRSCKKKTAKKNIQAFMALPNTSVLFICVLIHGWIVNQTNHWYLTHFPHRWPETFYHVGGTSEQKFDSTEPVTIIVFTTIWQSFTSIDHMTL